jgi:RNA-binding protein
MHFLKGIVIVSLLGRGTERAPRREISFTFGRKMHNDTIAENRSKGKGLQMTDLKGFQKKHLRSLGHRIHPVVLIGYKGMTDAVIQSLHDALERHELIKVKFIDLKEKEQKRGMVEEIEEKTGCRNVGLIGHTALFFRQNKDPEKRRIRIPERRK